MSETKQIPAWRACPNNGYIPTYVDMVDGEIMIPDNTTIKPPPKMGKPGHYLTVIGNKWYLVPDHSYSISYDEAKTLKEEEFERWSLKFADAPFISHGYPIGLSMRDLTLSNFLNFTSKNLDNPKNYLVLNTGTIITIEDDELYKLIAKECIDTIIERRSLIDVCEDNIRKALTVEQLDAITFPELNNVI